MKSWIKRNKKLVIFTLTMILGVGLASLFYVIFGHKFIEVMYKRESTWFLNIIIKGQKYPMLEWYYEIADKKIMWIFILWLIFTIFIFLFGLWVRNINRKKFLLTTVAFFSLFFGLYLFNCVKIGIVSFGKSAGSLIKKSELLSKRAETFDEKKALIKLGMNNINKFYYRFDEHINEAICEERNSYDNKLRRKSNDFGFEFNSDDVHTLKPKKGDSILEDGLLKLKYANSDYLSNIKTLNIDKDSIGKIEIKMKIKKGRRIQLGWSNDSSAEVGEEGEKIGFITINVIPDNAFYIYEIDAKSIFKRFFWHGDIIKKIFLIPSNVDGDYIEIDYIRFISKWKNYSERPYDETYETINKEMRKVIYANTLLLLKYEVNIPKKRSFLSFGMCILEEENPVRFRILVKCGNTRKEVFSEEVINNNIWQDEKIDFSEWAGKKIEISFDTKSTKKNIAFWSNPILYTHPKKRFNVIILLEDALRADHISCYGYYGNTTPVKDIFMKRGVLFLNAFSQATVTRPSCSSIMTSLYPTATGVWNFRDILDDKYLTLAEIMRNQGFATASFIQNDSAGPAAGLHQGFSNLFDPGSIGSRAEEIYNRKLYEWIDANIDRNFFLYLHLIDPHGPYDPQRPFDSWYKEAPAGKKIIKKDKVLDPDWVEMPTLEGRRLLYDGEISYNDYYFDGFLKRLEKNKLLEDSLIIFIADHGEHLGEHYLWDHHPPGYLQVIHVPMLMVYPKKLPGKMKIIQPVQLIDIMPTILDLANIKKDNFLLEGDSLLSLVNGRSLDFWGNRFVISEEVVNKDKDEKSEWASIFFRKWHIINSQAFIKRFGWPNFLQFFLTRVFNFIEDSEEVNYLNSFYFDMIFKVKVECLVSKLQKNNLKIWKALTGGKKRKIRYDPEVQERLKALGYLK